MGCYRGTPRPLAPEIMARKDRIMRSTDAERTMNDIATSPQDVIEREKLTDIRERMLDKTIADSFPASDPPSTDPDPACDSFAA